MNLVEKRRANLINLTYYAFLIAAYYFFMKYAFWLVAPFVIAFAVAMVLQKPLRVISKKTKIKKSYAKMSKETQELMKDKYESIMKVLF